MSGWQTLTPIPAVRNLASAVVSGNHIYVIGGCVEGAPLFNTPVLPIIRAKIDSDGTIGNWTTVTSLIQGKLAPGLHLTPEGYLYMIAGAGGQDIGASALANARNVRVAKIDPDGSWRETPNPLDADLPAIGDLPYSLSLLAMTKMGEYFYGLSGYRAYGQIAFQNQTVNFQVGEIVTGGTSGATMVVDSLTDAGATGTLISDHLNEHTFVNGEALTGDLGGAATCASDSTFTVASNGIIHRAQISTGGGIGAWENFAPLGFFPGPNAYMAVYGENFYYIDQENLRWGRPEEIRGGGWHSMPMPQHTGLIFTGPVVVGDTLIAVGGFASAATADVNCIRLGSNGPVSGWYRTQPFPTVIAGAGIGVDGNRIYVVGGTNGPDALDTVYVAQVQDGCIAGVKIPAPL